MKIKEENIPYNRRWFVIKLLENDPEIVEEAKKKLVFADEVFKEIEIVKSTLERKHKCDLPSYIARERFNLASQIARKAIKNVVELPLERISDKIDKFVTHPLSGIPIFFFIMWLVFKLTFYWSAPISDFIDSIFGELLPEVVSKYFSFLPDFAISLINDGVLAGVGAVMVFLPV